MKGKTVIVRVDLNSPVDPDIKKIRDNERIRAHSETLRELSGKGAKVVVLAHQGRKGEPSFLPLKEHAELLSKHIGKEVRYIPDLIGEEAVNAIKSLREGEIILLENVRMLDEETLKRSPEEHAESRLVKTLAPLADLFVQDAFSAAHRSHASIVGFSKYLLTVAGRVMERELRALSEILEAREDLILIMGGNKPDDCLSVIEALLKRGRPRIKHLLSAGVLGELLLKAEGRELGEKTEEYLRKKKFDKLLDEVKDIRDKLRERMKIPLDIAYEEDGERRELRVENLPASGIILDIGEETAEKYSGIIKNADTRDAIIVKGTPGAYEREEFRVGTKIIYEALRESRAFTLIGGGDSSTAIRLVGLKPEDFSYVSLAGGALISYLSGKPMPGVEVLAKKKD